MPMERVFSGAPWESQVGYCRAVKAGSLIFVTGTAPVTEGGEVFAPNEPYEQARRCLEIIEQSIKKFGADRKHIVRTRMFVTDITRWAEFGRAHREFFGDDKPATSMIQISKLIDPKMTIEIEADAVLI
jgi:enamine deaminase RidA (YjgF/YER057c/UK114 family)